MGILAQLLYVLPKYEPWLTKLAWYAMEVYHKGMIRCKYLLGYWNFSFVIFGFLLSLNLFICLVFYNLSKIKCCCYCTGAIFQFNFLEINVSSVVFLIKHCTATFTSLQHINARFLISFIQSANPGPGTYGELKSTETASSSFSKKGFGGFASKVSIKLTVRNNLPRIRLPIICKFM